MTRSRFTDSAAKSRPTLTRRGLLGAAAAALVAPGAWSPAQAAVIGPVLGHHRRAQALQIRIEAARNQHQVSLPDHPSNGDETRYASRIANYSKGLPHNAVGEVDPSAYQALITALTTGDHADFEQIPLGGSDPARQRLLVNPQSGLAFEVEGADCHHLGMPAAPAFDSAEQASELVELYWMALLRDVPFAEYAGHPLVAEAAGELSRLAAFRGPRDGGFVTPHTLFRGSTPGDLAGPYLSQFLLHDAPFGAQRIEQRLQTVLPGVDYLTTESEWLDIQNGHVPILMDQFDPARPAFIRNGRDLGQWVHIDVLFQAYFNAMLVLLASPDEGGIGAPLNGGNPYHGSRTQTGFGTFGGPAIATLVAEVSTRALHAVWFQKWFVHRRLRPEAFAGRVHHRIARSLGYPIHQDVLDAQALGLVFSRNGTYFLPQAYPEGSPLHPSYGAGHATVAGACVTILKALFDERYEIPNPVTPDAVGQTLLPYAGPTLTVGGELNKLAANVSFGRNFAGIHWRSDYAASLRLGEAVAISVLRDQRIGFNEPFSGYTFTTFDGSLVTV